MIRNIGKSFKGRQKRLVSRLFYKIPHSKKQCRHEEDDGKKAQDNALRKYQSHIHPYAELHGAKCQKTAYRSQGRSQNRVQRLSYSETECLFLVIALHESHFKRMQKEDSVVHRYGNLQYSRHVIRNKRNLSQKYIAASVQSDSHQNRKQKEKRLSVGIGHQKKNQENKADAQPQNQAHLPVHLFLYRLALHRKTGINSFVSHQTLDFFYCILGSRITVSIDENDMKKRLSFLIVKVAILSLHIMRRISTILTGIESHPVHAGDLLYLILVVQRFSHGDALYHDTGRTGITESVLHLMNSFLGRGPIRKILT